MLLPPRQVEHQDSQKVLWRKQEVCLPVTLWRRTLRITKEETQALPEPGCCPLLFPGGLNPVFPINDHQQETGESTSQ